MRRFYGKQRDTYIYGLAEQDTRIIRYVGMAENLRTRFYGHRSKSSKCTSRPLFKNGKRPFMVVLDHFPAGFKGYSELEKRWIKRMRNVARKLGTTLLNHEYTWNQKRGVSDKSSK